MKPRLLLTFALLTLLGLSLAGAAMAEPIASPASSVADASPSADSFLCSLSQTAIAPEVGLTPAPALKAGNCGPCSLSPCVGATIGNFCQIGTRQGRCQNVYGEICTGSTSGINKCQCWSGPLP